MTLSRLNKDEKKGRTGDRQQKTEIIKRVRRRQKRGTTDKSGLESRIICVTNCGGFVFEVQWTQRSLANLAMPL